MGFVVEAELDGVTRVWISEKLPDGSRTLVTRDVADTFPTPMEAQAAIEELPLVFRSIAFAIEPAA